MVQQFQWGVESKVDMDHGVHCSEPKEDPEYPRDGRKICLIICVQETSQALRLKKAHQTTQREEKKDVIQKAFNGLGYECRVLQDPRDITRKAIMDELSKYQYQWEDISHFVCWLLTYHTDGPHFYAHDKPISLKDITGSFLGSTFETLAGKPKLFFVDSAYVECKKEDQLAHRECPGQRQGSYLIPTTADFLIGFSPFGQEETKYAEVVCQAVEDHVKGDLGDNFITALDVTANKLERNDVTSTYISTLTKTFSMSRQR
ncbi:caspase-6-like [Ornithodoros turicata]